MLEVMLDLACSITKYYSKIETYFYIHIVSTINRLVSPFRSSERGLKMFCSSIVSLPMALGGHLPRLASYINFVGQPCEHCRATS